jgi:hypothetical protein
LKSEIEKIKSIKKTIKIIKVKSHIKIKLNKIIRDNIENKLF